MHKLFFIMGFMGLCVVTQPALGTNHIGKYSTAQLAAACEAARGKFGLTATSYYCEYPNGGTTECLLTTNQCIQFGDKGKKLINHQVSDKNTTKVPGAGQDPTRGGSKVAPGAISGLGNATRIPGATAGSSTGAILTPTGPGPGVGSAVSGSVGAGSVTAVNPAALSPTLQPMGGAFGVTRLGLGAGPITGGINGRKLQ